MTETDRKEFKKIVIEGVGEALEEIVLPRLQNLEDDVKVLKDDVEDLKNTTGRIELTLHAVIDRQDEQDDDITKIKKVLKLEPNR